MTHREPGIAAAVGVVAATVLGVALASMSVAHADSSLSPATLDATIQTYRVTVAGSGTVDLTVPIGYDHERSYYPVTTADGRTLGCLLDNARVDISASRAPLRCQDVRHIDFPSFDSGGAS